MNTQKSCIVIPGWFIVFTACFRAEGQHTIPAEKETILVHCDKKFLQPGDTLWFRANVLEGARPGTTSKSLYVDLFSKEGRLINAALLPVDWGTSYGQMAIPKNISPGIYFFRACTRKQITEDARVSVIPLSVYTAGDEKLPGITANTFKGAYKVNIQSDPQGLLIGVSGPGMQDRNKPAKLVLYDDNLPLVSLPLSAKNESRGEFLISLPAAIRNRLLYWQLFLADTLVQDGYYYPDQTDPGIKIITDSLDFSAKGWNVWSLQFPDSILYNLSVSVTDGSLPGNPSPLQMAAIKSEARPVGSFHPSADSSYLSFSGKALTANSRKSHKNKSLLAFIRTADSSLGFYNLPVNDSGEFRLANLFFYDSATVQFQLSDKGCRGKDLRLQLDEFTTPPFAADEGATKIIELHPPDPALVRITREKELFQQHQQGKLLSEVVLKTRIKSRVELLDETYATGGFRGQPNAGQNARGFDVIRDAFAQGYPTILDFVASRTGVQIIRSKTGQPQVVQYWGESLTFFVDEVECDINRINSLSTSQIAYVKLFPPPFMMVFFGKGAIAVYLKKGHELEAMPGDGLLMTKLRGYTRSFEFRQPDYSNATIRSIPDNRMTLYWEPVLVTEGNKKTVVRFYNNDFSRSFRIRIEGVNDRGELIRMVKVIRKE